MSCYKTQQASISKLIRSIKGTQTRRLPIRYLRGVPRRLQGIDTRQLQLDRHTLSRLVIGTRRRFVRLLRGKK